MPPPDLTPGSDLRLVIGQHARERMEQRRVSIADIRHALSPPLLSWATPSGSIQAIGEGVDGRHLKVWLKRPGIIDRSREIIVLSVAWKGEEDPA